MRIFYSPNNDPMLLDSRADLSALHQMLTRFLLSDAAELSIPADVTFSPAPYSKFLKGLRVQKIEGPVSLRLADDSWLELQGAQSKWDETHVG